MSDPRRELVPIAKVQRKKIVGKAKSSPSLTQRSPNMRDRGPRVQGKYIATASHLAFSVDHELELVDEVTLKKTCLAIAALYLEDPAAFDKAIMVDRWQDFLLDIVRGKHRKFTRQVKMRLLAEYRAKPKEVRYLEFCIDVFEAGWDPSTHPPL